MALPTIDRTPLPASFTRLVLAGLGLAIFVTIAKLPTNSSDAPRENHLSVLGVLLPESAWTSPAVLAIAIIGFLAGILLWTVSPRATAGAVIAVIGLVLLGSYRVENELYARHQLFQPVAVLGILTAGTAFRKGKLDLPAWIWTAVAVAVGWGYTLSGVEKLAASGLDWADGTALRLWLTAFTEGDAIADWVIGTPWVARLGQIIVLFVETTAVVGLAFRRTRIPYALALLGFHLMMEWWMGLAFYANEFTLIALCATFFLGRQSAPT